MFYVIWRAKRLWPTPSSKLLLLCFVLLYGGALTRVFLLLLLSLGLVIQRPGYKYYHPDECIVPGMQYEKELGAFVSMRSLVLWKMKMRQNAWNPVATADCN